MRHVMRIWTTGLVLNHLSTKFFMMGYFGAWKPKNLPGKNVATILFSSTSIRFANSRIFQQLRRLFLSEKCRLINSTLMYIIIFSKYLSGMCILKINVIELSNAINRPQSQRLYTTVACRCDPCSEGISSWLYEEEGEGFKLSRSVDKCL